MTTLISDKIVNAIRQSDFSEDVKSLLENLVRLEAPHIDEASWRYTESYESTINAFLKKMGYDE